MKGGDYVIYEGKAWRVGSISAGMAILNRRFSYTKIAYLDEDVVPTTKEVADIMGGVDE